MVSALLCLIATMVLSVGGWLFFGAIQNGRAWVWAAGPATYSRGARRVAWTYRLLAGLLLMGLGSAAVVDCLASLFREGF